MKKLKKIWRWFVLLFFEEVEIEVALTEKEWRELLNQPML
jgi:hypothetical protein